MHLPFYQYADNQGCKELQRLWEEWLSNLDVELVASFAQSITLRLEREPEGEGRVCFASSSGLRPEFRETFAPTDLLDYTYAVLHASTYQRKYNESLKIDFSSIPNPSSAAQFWQLAALGAELRQLHLLKHPSIKRLLTKFPVSGSNIVNKPAFVQDINNEQRSTDEVTGRVYLNEDQYFDSVPQTAWEFSIGGYQPSQKWLKDRQGHELQPEDILHYQRLVVAMLKTTELIRQIEGAYLAEGNAGTEV